MVEVGSVVDGIGAATLHAGIDTARHIHYLPELMWSRRVGVAAFAATIGCLAGCAGPRIVRGVTSRGDEVKFLYYQGSDTGVIKCKMAGDGALSDCKPMTVELEP